MKPSSSRRARTNRWRRVSRAALAVGSLLAAALAAASLWVSWLAIVGVGVAVVAAVTVAWAGWQEFVEYREARNAELRQTTESLTDRLRTVREEHGAVLDVVVERTHALTADLSAARTQNGELTSQVSRLRGDNEALRLENTGLRRTLRAQERTISDLESRIPAEDPSGELVVLPRRRDTGEEPLFAWEAAEAETVINLDLARLATPYVEGVLRREAN